MGIRMVEVERRANLGIEEHAQVVDELEPVLVEYRNLVACYELYWSKVAHAESVAADAQLRAVMDHVDTLPATVEAARARVDELIKVPD